MAERQRGESDPREGTFQTKANHPRREGELRNYGWTKHGGKSMGLGVENLNQNLGLTTY